MILFVFDEILGFHLPDTEDTVFSGKSFVRCASLESKVQFTLEGQIVHILKRQITHFTEK